MSEALIFTSSTGDTKRMGSYDQKYLHKIWLTVYYVFWSEQQI